MPLFRSFPKYTDPDSFLHIPGYPDTFPESPDSDRHLSMYELPEKPLKHHLWPFHHRTGQICSGWTIYIFIPFIKRLCSRYAFLPTNHSRTSCSILSTFFFSLTISPLTSFPFIIAPNLPYMSVHSLSALKYKNRKVLFLYNTFHINWAFQYQIQHLFKHYLF